MFFTKHIHILCTIVGALIGEEKNIFNSIKENKINAYKFSILVMSCQLKTVGCLPEAIKVAISTSSIYLNVLS